MYRSLRLGYSLLDQIDRDNLGTLRMVWSRTLTEGSQEAMPLAYGGMLYIPNPGGRHPGLSTP